MRRGWAIIFGVGVGEVTGLIVTGYAFGAVGWFLFSCAANVDCSGWRLWCHSLRSAVALAVASASNLLSSNACAIWLVYLLL